MSWKKSLIGERVVKATFKNTLHVPVGTKNIPFMIEQTPIGIVTDTTDEDIFVEIWDKYVGWEMQDNNTVGLYLSEKEQYTYDEFMKLMSNKK
jgi:hypothetical protein